MNEIAKQGTLTRVMGQRGCGKKLWWTIIFPLVFFFPDVSSYFPVYGFSGVHAKAGEAPGGSTATREGRLAVFDDVWQTIHDRYYDPVFRPEAAEAPSSQDFYSVLQRMVGSLSDAHTRVYATEEKFDWWKPRFVGV